MVWNAIVTQSQSKYDSLIDPLDEAWSNYMDPASETDQQRQWQETFFAAVRSEFGSLTVEGVEGLKSIIFCHRTYWADSPISYLAWFLGNIRREVGANMQPIKETQRRNETHISDKKVVARLNHWWASGDAQRAQVRSRYWLTTAAYPFGRGLFQTTHHFNYVKSRSAVKDTTGVDIPFDEDYNLMLDPLASAIGAYAMALKGDFTGKALINYLGEDGKLDYRNARRVINGDTKNYDTVAGYCRSFEKALLAAEAAVPGWLSKKLHIFSPVLPISKASKPAEENNASDADLFNQISIAVNLLAVRGGHKINTPISPIELNDDDFDVRINDQTQQDNSGVNPMKQVDGLKTYIVAAAVALIGISEGVLGVDIPGAEMQENWIEMVLGAAGLGTVRHAIAKLIRAVAR